MRVLPFHNSTVRLRFKRASRDSLDQGSSLTRTGKQICNIHIMQASQEEVKPSDGFFCSDRRGKASCSITERAEGSSEQVPACCLMAFSLALKCSFILAGCPCPLINRQGQLTGECAGFSCSGPSFSPLANQGFN